jgi:hypothetical protein
MFFIDVIFQFVLLVVGGGIYGIGLLFGRFKIIKTILHLISGVLVLIALANLFIIAWALFT